VSVNVTLTTSAVLITEPKKARGVLRWRKPKRNLTQPR
jgi:hypothetical protein